MKRKQKKQRKKILTLLLVPLGLFAASLLVVGASIVYPYALNTFTPKSQVKSAYIKQQTKKELEVHLNTKKITYTNIEVTDEGEGFSVSLKGGTIAKIAATKDIVEQLNTLHRLLRRLTIDNKQVKSIDLRFTRPVVKY